MEREKGFEPGAFPAVSRIYDTAEGDGGGPRRPQDASGRVASGTDGSDVHGGSPLPSPTPDLFIAAGAIVAGWAESARELRATVDGFLRRALDQAEALRSEGV
jgi:hypothetical protein